MASEKTILFSRCIVVRLPFSAVPCGNCGIGTVIPLTACTASTVVIIAQNIVIVSPAILSMSCHNDWILVATERTRP